MPLCDSSYGTKHACQVLGNPLSNVGGVAHVKFCDGQMEGKGGWGLDKIHVPVIKLYFNPVHCEVYSIQHYVIKFVSDLSQVGGFLRFPPPIKLTATI
jgi:hypothetical protein